MCVCWNFAARNDILMSKISGWINIYLLQFVWHSQKSWKYVHWAKAKAPRKIREREGERKWNSLRCFALFNFYKFSQLLKWFIFKMYFVINMVHHFQYTLSHSEMNSKCIPCVAHSNSSSQNYGMKTMHVHITSVHEVHAIESISPFIARILFMHSAPFRWNGFGPTFLAQSNCIMNTRFLPFLEKKILAFHFNLDDVQTRRAKLIHISSKSTIYEYLIAWAFNFPFVKDLIPYSFQRHSFFICLI